jgi:hypothetical protein
MIEGGVRDLVEPVDLSNPDGTVNPHAIGRSARPLHRCGLPGLHLRHKRWDYWCVVAADCILAVTVADIGYLGLVNLWLCDRRSGRTAQRTAVTARGGRLSLAQQADVPLLKAPLSARVAVAHGPSHLVLQARSGTDVAVDLAIDDNRTRPSLNVVVPWAPRRFHFTSKQLALPVRGEIRWGTRRYQVGEKEPALASLDFGRGVWPHRARWQWAQLAGVTATGEPIGVNLGALWTDGTGANENGLVYDNTVDWLADARFAMDDRARTARITTTDERVDVRFTAIHERASWLELGLVGARATTWFGRFEGVVVTARGPRPVDGLFGWAEDVTLRW